MTYALIGDYQKESQGADALNKQFPRSTAEQFQILPMIRAAAIFRRDARKAIEILNIPQPYELGSSALLYPTYLRGYAYIELKQGAAAAAEFQKIIDHPGLIQNDIIGALAKLGLARAYVVAGDAKKAKTAYGNFLTLWKDGDPDIPILKEAKAEYAKLQ
jgi:hypothetical protein